ncbi:MAG: hypothetical protein WDN23_05405 [Edaphobacter sp.]
MKKLCLVSLSAILLCPFLSGQTQTNSIPVPVVEHPQRIYRLRVLFRQLGLRLDSDDPTFNELQTFKQQVNRWALEAPYQLAPPPDSISLAKESYPGGGERFLRSTVLKAEVIQQPKSAQVTDPTTGAVSTQQNPNEMLWKASAVTDFSQLVPTTSDVQTQAVQLKASGVDLSRPGAGKALCSDFVTPPGQPATRQSFAMEHGFNNCVLRTGTSYTFARIGSGFKGTFSWAQNPKIQSNILVPEQYTSLNQAFAGEVDFDPTKVFLTGSDWNSAYLAANSYSDHEEYVFVSRIAAKCHVPLAPEGSQRTGLMTTDCAKKLARPQGLSAIAAVITPTVTFIEKTNFDFFASGGQLVPNPFPSKRLADLTFSFDLTRLIPNAKARQDAMATLAAAQQKVPGPSPNPNRTDVYNQVCIWASEPEQIDNDTFYANLRTALTTAVQQMPPN